MDLEHKVRNELEKLVNKLDPQKITISDSELTVATNIIHALQPEYISKHEAGDIIWEHILNNLPLSPLSQAEIESWREELVGSIFEHITSYPHEYRIRIELPNCLTLGNFFQIEITDNISFWSESRSRSLNDSYLNSNHSDLDQNTTFGCLIVKAKGYTNFHPDSLLISEAIALAKLFSFFWENMVSSHGDFYRDLIASASIEDITRKTLHRVYLPSTVLWCFSNLRINKRQLFGNNWKNEVASDRLEEYLIDSFTHIKKFLSFKSHDDYETIAAAIEWYQESLYSDNQTIAFLSACIGLEALLGEKGRTDGITTKLADNFAAILGAGKTHRAKLAQKYREILNLRASLVHARSARLKDDDLKKLFEVRGMLLEIILHELNQMYKPQKNR